MGYLLDTNIISELQKSNCEPKVRAFIENVPNEDLFTSVLVMGEIAYGVKKMPDGKKRNELALWLNRELPKWFDGRIINVDLETMFEWGNLLADCKNTLPVMDSLIAATAVANGLTLVTRNAKDFEAVEGLSLLNPWN
jgi:predicted nucleic acid-binding protein